MEKPVSCKLMEFPSGKHIIPDGFIMVDTITIGEHGTFELPINAIVPGDLDGMDLAMNIFDHLAYHYNWPRDPNAMSYGLGSRSFSSSIHTVGDIVLPKTVDYCHSMNPSTIIDIFYTLALYYRWPKVENNTGSGDVK